MPPRYHRPLSLIKDDVTLERISTYLHNLSSERAFRIRLTGTLLKQGDLHRVVLQNHWLPKRNDSNIRAIPPLSPTSVALVTSSANDVAIMMMATPPFSDCEP